MCMSRPYPRWPYVAFVKGGLKTQGHWLQALGVSLGLPACHLDVSHRLELLAVAPFKALIGLASVRRKPRA